MSSVITPPLSTFSTTLEARSPVSAPTSPETVKQSTQRSHSPNQFLYYCDYLNKADFNLILINSAVKLLRAIYDNINENKIRFFIVEILRRLKTSIQLLQIACYYLAKLAPKANQLQLICSRKLFLSLIILALKFNQDYNYLFKLWLKICGSNNDDELSVKELRDIEMKVLNHLNYELYLNAATYENWCNILMIFSYDFIAQQRINAAEMHKSDFEFVLNSDSILMKFTHWMSIFTKLNLKVNTVQFRAYFNSKIGSKITFVEPTVPLLFKRSVETFENEAKKCKIIQAQI